MTDNTTTAASGAASLGEEQAFEAWYKMDCAVAGVGAKVAAKAAWHARAALAAPAAQEAEPATSAPVEGTAAGWKSHAEAMERERDYYRQRVRTLDEHQEGQVWYWQDDGGDHLESMVGSLPVVIRADQLRALLAVASRPQADAGATAIAPDISADLERSDWTAEEALRWYAAGKHYDTVPNRDGSSSARILDNGAVASNALKSLSREYAEHKGDVALQEAAAAPQAPAAPTAAEHDQLQRTAVGWQQRAAFAERNWLQCYRVALCNGADPGEFKHKPGDAWHTTPAPAAGAAPPDAMVDAYLLAQRRAVEEADRFGRSNIGALHARTVREACRAGLAAALAAASAQEEDDGWMPIETAPKDGTEIDLFNSGGHREAGAFWGLPPHECGEMGRYCDSDWHDYEPGWVTDFWGEPQPDSHFTHWRLPPAPPAARARQEGQA